MCAECPRSRAHPSGLCVGMCHIACQLLRYVIFMFAECINSSAHTFGFPSNVLACVFLHNHSRSLNYLNCGRHGGPQHRATAPRPDPTALRRILSYSPFASGMHLFHTYIRSADWLRFGKPMPCGWAAGAELEALCPSASVHPRGCRLNCVC